MPEITDTDLAAEVVAKLQLLDERLVALIEPCKADLDGLATAIEQTAEALSDRIAVFEGAAKTNPNFLALKNAADAVSFALSQIKQQSQIMDAKLNPPIAPGAGPIVYPPPPLPVA